MRERHRDHERAERAFWFMAGRGGMRGGFGGGSGMRGGGRGGARDMLRAGRLFGDGDLKLIVLALLEEAPRHGYDVIKALEERSSGVYSASPGVVYPTLTFLEEAGHAVSAAEGSRKVFSITEAGRALLEENRHAVARLFEHLERFGRKMARAREWFGWEEEDKPARPGRDAVDLRAMRRRLRAALAEVLDMPKDKQAEALAILERAAGELEALGRG